MKFLFMSLDGLIGDTAWQVVKEGHEVKYFIEHEEEREVTDGFVEKVTSYEQYIDWADVIIFDDVLGQGKLAKKLREQGKLVVGGTPYTDMLEDDRNFGQEEMKKAGIPIISYQDFSDFDSAITYVQANPGRYVLKPSLDTLGSKSILYVGEDEDGKDLIQVLSDYKKAYSKKIKTFQLQKKITGVEVAVGAFFNGKEFVLPICVNFENKKLFPGNLGPSTGEMGTHLFWSEPNVMFNQTLKKMEVKLAEEHYVGYIDINCIVNGNGIYPLEWTSRFGYPIVFIQQESMTTPIGEFLHDLAAGTSSRFRAKNGFHVGVRIVVPPFPFHDPKTFEIKSKDSVILFSKGRDGVHIEDVKLVNDEWVVTGTAGVVLVVCGSGPTMKLAQAQAYGRIKNIIIPHMYYRTDIGDRWFEDFDRMHSWGYFRE